MRTATHLESVQSAPQAAGPVLELELSMRSEIAAISPAADRLMALIKETHGLADEASDIEMALREALANAVIHGNRRDTRKKVHIHCRIQPGNELSIVVRDEGRGFDLGEASKRATNGNGGSEHHLGIYLMKQLMDEVRFERGGAEVHLRKRLASVNQ